MLIKRVLSSIVLIPAVLFILYYTSVIWFALTICAVEILAAYEMSKIAVIKNNQVNQGIIFSSIVIISISTILNDPFFYYISLTTAVVLALFWNLFSADEVNQTFDGFTVNIFIIIYVGWLLNHSILLYKINPHLVLMVLLITWMNDSGAYFAGKSFGKHKLAPKISPGKTWEGSFGGLVVGVLAAYAVNFYIALGYSNISIIFISIVISAAGQIGDLVESAIKRSCGVKDSGNIIPGHGGLLDRIDSLIFTFPVAYYCFKFLELL